MTQTHINGIILICFIISFGTYMYLCGKKKSSYKSVCISGGIALVLLMIIKFVL